MTDYLYYDGLSIPIIRIGRGSSKFFSNLVRSYAKNYDMVNVVAKGHKINLAIWVIYQLSSEYLIRDITVNWEYHNIYISFFVYSKHDPVQIDMFQPLENQYYVKVGKNSDEDTLHRLINKNDQCYIVAAGSSCIIACQLLLYALSVGFMSSNIEVIKTTDSNGNEKAGMKVYIYKPMPYNNEAVVYNMQGFSVQEETL
jgi:hypothetical protein